MKKWHEIAITGIIIFGLFSLMSDRQTYLFNKAEEKISQENEKIFQIQNKLEKMNIEKQFQDAEIIILKEKHKILRNEIMPSCFIGQSTHAQRR